MNLQDYAFLRNHLDCIEGHDRYKMPAWAHMPVFGDIRNEWRAKCEMWAFANYPPRVGEKYAMYVKQGAVYPTLTNWTGEQFKMQVRFGKSWKRNWNLFTPVFASVGDQKWRGIWSHAQDLVIMRRIA